MKLTYQKLNQIDRFLLAILVIVLIIGAKPFVEPALASVLAAPITTDNAPPSVTYTPVSNWTHVNNATNALWSTLSWSSIPGSRAIYSFNGSTITRFSSMATNRGCETVYIDGINKGISNSYAPETRRQIGKTWTVPAGNHTIEVEVTCAGGTFSDIDAFAVDIATVGAGAYDNTHTQVRYFGTWTANTNVPDAYNNTNSWTNVAGSGFRFTFTGDTTTYVYTTANNRGEAAITIDDINKGYLDLYSNAVIRQQTKTYTDLGPGPHVLNVVATGRTTGGNSGAILIDVDALKVGNSATTTLCDSVPKYYCAYVTYVENTNNREILKRWYRGGRDGGAQQWQLWFAKDWEVVNGSRVLKEQFPASQWYTNISLSSYYSQPAQRKWAVNSLVQMRFKYTECVNGQPCTNWCSTYLEYNLSNGTSSSVGNGVCTQ